MAPGRSKDSGRESSDDDPKMPVIEWIGRRPDETPGFEAHETPASAVAFCDSIAAQFPDLAVVLADHRADMHGETLAHLFMSDIARWYLARFQAGDLLSTQGLADWLDAVYPMADDYVRNVVDVSFLEDLPWPPDPDAEATDLLGPNLRRVLTDMQDGSSTA